LGHHASKYHDSIEEEGRRNEYADSCSSQGYLENKDMEQKSLMSPGTVGAIEKGLNQMSSEAFSLAQKDQMTFDNESNANAASHHQNNAYKFYE
jgi:hypothetical protein